ncbi:uncharacterized protein LOC123291794 [Chrysoperla carnea]|uniref:uncharacterized protein LOC123291794 n=1 Tax=Chrysoperla carnea TaxID=189513 RepID=UPI001D0922AA|nr:uncharacterized protein LOC123291794 [Chrysoperla carnea]
MAMAKIYREMQCTPILDAKNQCPRAYDCQIFRTISANPNKCYWNNTEYDVGSQLPNELTEMDCFASCYCSSSKDLRRTELNIVQAGFRCANIECPGDVDYNNSPPEAGCHYEHNL